MFVSHLILNVNIVSSTCCKMQSIDFLKSQKAETLHKNKKVSLLNIIPECLLVSFILGLGGICIILVEALHKKKVFSNPTPECWLHSYTGNAFDFYYI